MILSVCREKKTDFSAYDSQNYIFLKIFYQKLNENLSPEKMKKFEQEVLKKNHKELIMWEYQKETIEKPKDALLCDMCKEYFTDFKQKITKGVYTYCSFKCFRLSRKVIK